MTDSVENVSAVGDGKCQAVIGEGAGGFHDGKGCAIRALDVAHAQASKDAKRRNLPWVAQLRPLLIHQR